MQVGFLLFPGVQQLDASAPYEVFATWGGAEIRLIWKQKVAVVSSTGLAFTADASFEDCPPLDVICVPGGVGINALLLDDDVLNFVRKTASRASHVASVCTGALVLGAAGLLKGRRATTHWTCLDLLASFGAIPTPERVVRDGKIMTGGGVTAGLDLALALIGEIAGRQTAEAVQLQLEYAPAPPFDAGRPSTAPREVVDAVRSRGASLRGERERLVGRAAAKLGIV